MTPMPADIREFLSTRFTTTLLPEEVIQKQIDLATLIVANEKSSTLSSANEDLIITVYAGWLSYIAYCAEIEVKTGEVPQMMYAHQRTLERLAMKMLMIAALATATGYQGIEGLMGDQRSELNADRIAGSIPADEEI